MSKKTKQIMKWGIAVFLAVIVMLAFVLSKSADRILKATDFELEEEVAQTEEAEEEPDLQEDTVTLTIPAEAPDGEDEEESSAEGVSGEETETEEQDDDSAEETPGSGDGAQEQEEEPAEQENADNKAEAEAEDERDPAEYPAQVLRAIAADGAQVIVDAPAGCLPAGSYVTVSIVKSNEAAEAVESALDNSSSEVVDIVLYDIVICAADGTEIQPDARVRVSIIAPDKKGDSTSVYHVTDDGQAEKVGEGDPDGGVSFDTENF